MTSSRLPPRFTVEEPGYEATNEYTLGHCGLSSRSASDKYTGIIEKPEVKTQAHSSVQLTAPCFPVSFQSLLPANKKL